jgi:hypothetical protein
LFFFASAGLAEHSTGAGTEDNGSASLRENMRWGKYGYTGFLMHGSVLHFGEC